MSLELSITLLENIHSTGVIHYDIAQVTARL